MPMEIVFFPKSDDVFSVLCKIVGGGGGLHERYFLGG